MADTTDANEAAEQSPQIKTLRDAKALSAVANPVRSRMMDALTVDGPSTASGLAKRTGQAVGSASHHLKVLAEAGLVVEDPELARDRRERWWRLVSIGTQWSRADFSTDAGAVTAAMAAEAVILQRQFERTRDWLANSEADPDWLGAAFDTQSWLKLDPGELAAFSEELLALIRRWRQRERPADDAQEAERESIFVFARGFPAQP